MEPLVKDIKSVRTWFNKNHRYIPDKDVYFYTLSSLSANSIKEFMEAEMKKYPPYEDRRELLHRIVPSRYRTNSRQRLNYITQDDLDNRKIIDIILYMIDYILKARSTNKKMYEEKTNSVLLPVKTIEKTYGDTNLAFWAARIACHLKILEIGSQYETTSGKPRSYRIHPKHLCNQSNLIISERCIDKTIDKNIKGLRRKAILRKSERRKDIYNQPVQLYSFYYLDRLRINRQAAMAYWKNWLQEQLKEFNPDTPDCQGKIARLYMKYFSSVTAVYRLEANDRFLTRDSYGRIHSNLTNFPRLLRPFLYFEGCPEPLYQLDLSNSQPLMLVFLFQEYFKELYGKNLSTSDKLVAFCKKQGFVDVPKYIELVMDGKLYFELYRIQKDLTELPDRKLTFEEKEALKDLIFKLFFGRKEDIERIAGFVDKFEKVFPTVWTIIKHFKRHSHKTLAHKLQTTESGIFIDNVLRPLLVKNHLPYVLSIHDCIVCPKSLITVVKQQIEHAFSKAKFKLKYTTLKIEGLGEDHEKDETMRILIANYITNI